MAHGDNLLRSSRLVESLLAQTSIGPEDVVLDVGAGTGAITLPLARRCRLVIAFENDPVRADQLRHRLATSGNVELRQADFLTSDLPLDNYKVFANIPFHRTAEIMRKLTASGRPPQDAYLIMQRAAALRFMGRPLALDSMYSTLLKPFFEFDLKHTFKRTDFLPPPKVDIVLMRMRRLEMLDVEATDIQQYRDFIVYSYTQWRPTLRSSLSGVLTDRQMSRLARELGIARTATPTELTVGQWLALYRFVRTLPPTIQAVYAGAEARVARRDASSDKIHRTREAADWRAVSPRVVVTSRVGKTQRQ